MRRRLRRAGRGRIDGQADLVSGGIVVAPHHADRPARHTQPPGGGAHVQLARDHAGAAGLALAVPLLFGALAAKQGMAFSDIVLMSATIRLI